MRSNQFETMTEALLSLKSRGYDDEIRFDPTGNASLNDEPVDPTHMTIVEHHRFEGMSSSDDMAVVYAILGENGHKSVLIDSFGPQADPLASEFIKQLNLREED